MLYGTGMIGKSIAAKTFADQGWLQDRACHSRVQDVFRFLGEEEANRKRRFRLDAGKRQFLPVNQPVTHYYVGKAPLMLGLTKPRSDAEGIAICPLVCESLQAL